MNAGFGAPAVSGDDSLFSLFPLKLLARLEGRRSLKEVEPRLFAEEDAPMHGNDPPETNAES